MVTFDAWLLQLLTTVNKRLYVGQLGNHAQLALALWCTCPLLCSQSLLTNQRSAAQFAGNLHMVTAE